MIWNLYDSIQGGHLPNELHAADEDWNDFEAVNDPASGKSRIASIPISESQAAPPSMIFTSGRSCLIRRARHSEGMVCWKEEANPTMSYCRQSRDAKA